MKEVILRTILLMFILTSSTHFVEANTYLTENSTWSAELTGSFWASIALADADNDGDLDLALTGCSNGGGNTASCNTPASFIYINNGTSLVEDSTWKGDITDVWKSSIAFGDINDDGKLDLALTGQTDTAIVSKVYINNGTGFAENSTWQSDLTGIFFGAIVLGDINNDTKLDLIIAGRNASGGGNQFTEIYINNGTQLVANSSWSSNLLNVDQSSIVLGDYDNDGDLDLSLIGHISSDRHRIYNNTGTTFKRL